MEFHLFFLMQMRVISRFQSSEEIDTIMLYESIFCGIWALILVFITCEVSQRYSNAYEAIGDEVDRIDWYLVPRDLHPTLLIFTMYMQNPCEIKFFGSISCNREQFKGVRKRANRTSQLKD